MWLEANAPPQWAPMQPVYGSSGATGPVQEPGGAAVNTSNSSQQTYDPTLTWKLAGTIVLALALVFVLQGLGFRFVGSASVGLGR